ncbi:MAG: PilZ domain-containing protein [Candidatus Goldbacteria bacterium]|nr:PilZ domain-containing protein [Candidatus Goldiibacteriota bacterium]
MEMQKGWLYKRQYERVPDVLKVLYYPVKDSVASVLNSEDYKDTTIEKITQKGGASSLIQAMTEDISKGGLSILTEEPLSVGQHIIIDLFLPKVKNPIKILAEVRNIEKSVKSSSSYKAGLKIISISKSDLKRIESRIMEIKLGNK